MSEFESNLGKLFQYITATLQWLTSYSVADGKYNC